jgi:hypothetical protein
MVYAAFAMDKNQNDQDMATWQSAPVAWLDILDNQFANNSKNSEVECLVYGSFMLFNSDIM